MKISINEKVDKSDMKQKLVVIISEIIKGKNQSQASIADLLGLDQAKVSKLTWCKVEGFSLQRLLNLLTKLGVQVYLDIKLPDNIFEDDPHSDL